MTGPVRRTVPMKVQLAVALTQLAAAFRKLGLIPVEEVVQWELDHDPALGLRPLNDDGTDYVPPQHAVSYLVWRTKAAHLAKTTGRRGTSDLSLTYNGDVSRIAKTDRVADGHKDFQRRLLAKEPGVPAKRKNTIPSRRKPPKTKRLGAATRPVTRRSDARMNESTP